MHIPSVKERVSDKEMARRHEAVRALMKERGIDLLLVAGNGFIGSRGYLRYLTNWQPLFSEYYLLPIEAPPVFFARHKVRAQLMRELFDIDVRHPEEVARPSPPAALIAQEIKGFRPTLLGLAGLDTMNADFFHQLMKELPNLAWTDASAILDKVRMVKSDEEIAWVQRSAEAGERGWEVFCQHVRPGQREARAFAEVEYAVRLMGAVATFFMMTSDPHPVPKFLDLACDEYREGDIAFFNCELAGPGGYFTQIVRTVFLGHPSQEVVDASRTCQAALEAGWKELRPGRRACDIYHAIKEVITASGLRMDLHPGHSQGLDIFERPYISPSDITEIQPNMVIVIHPHLVTPSGVGIWMGDTFITTEGKARRLHKAPQDLKVIR